MNYDTRSRTRTYTIVRDPLNGDRWQVRVRQAHAGQDAVYGDAGDACETQQEAEHKLHDFTEYDRGYDAQMQWLVDNNTTLEQARGAHASRLTTAERNPYNDGGTFATLEYIIHLEAKEKARG